MKSNKLKIYQLCSTAIMNYKLITKYELIDSLTLRKHCIELEYYWYADVAKPVLESTF